MLQPNEARSAIAYLFKDVTGLEIGNPQPYVRSFFASEELIGPEFNELMVDPNTDTIKNIFYGTVTMSYAPFSEPYDLQFLLKNFLKCDVNFDSIAFKVAMTVDPESTGSLVTNPMFIQYMDIEGISATVALDGYIFALKKPTP